MKSATPNKVYWLAITVFVLLGSFSVMGQTRPPLLQDIVVRKGPSAEPTPLVKKTGSSSARIDDVDAATLSARRIKTSIPVLADATIPGYSGILVETLDGKVVVESGSDIPLNPASNVKIATAYAVLKTFGPDYRFATNVWTDGTIDRATATLNGNLYISGRDPVFGYEHAVTIANHLNRLGIRSITGGLYVTDNFSMNYSNSASRSANALAATLDSASRTSSATRVWNAHLVHAKKLGTIEGTPGVSIAGETQISPIPSSLHLLFSHESTPMREIVKVTLSYSNNFLSERLGDMVGGPAGVARIVRSNAGVEPSEFYLASASGLGTSRVTARAMMKLLHTLRAELGRHQMRFADIMPVAGLDDGTLEERFSTDYTTGSVIGKTGTLRRTDSGVSSLSGEIHTRGGTLLFVIFNQRGGVSRFRSFQNHYVSLIQGQFGGAAPISYTPVDMDIRMAATRVSYPFEGLE